MNKLIICTTAILRGNLHERSLGDFYKKFFNILKNYKVYHIINLDEPEKLKKKISKDETIKIFNKIIPNFVKKIIINNENIGFTKAYVAIMKKIKQLKLIDDKTIVWWFEDDWKCIRNYNFFNICNKLFRIKNSAITITNMTPLGSIRGGPIMNNSYFSNIFDIHELININKDPEIQIGKYTGGLKRNGKSRNLKNNRSNIINIIGIYFNKPDIKKLCMWYYKNKLKTRFNENIIIKFHLIKMENENSNVLKYIEFGNKKEITIKNFFKENNNFYDIYSDSYENIIKNLKKITFPDLINIFNDESLCYFILNPDILVDIGRDFQKKNGLKKWDGKNGNITY